MPFPVSEDDVVAAEAALAGRLPQSLRSRLMRDNGGEVATDEDDFEMFKVLDSADPVRRARTSARDFVRENSSLRARPGFPTEALAIADNGTGDALVLLKDHGSYGETVLLWRHETAELTEVGNIDDLVG